MSDDIETLAVEFEEMVRKMETFMTLNGELLESGGSRVKKMAGQREFLQLANDIDKWMKGHWKHEEVLRMVFDETDIAARLHYIYDMAMEAPEKELFEGTVDFPQTVEAIIIKLNCNAITWQHLQDMGQLNVGFGVAGDQEFKNQALIAAGRQDEVVEEVDNASDVSDDDAPPPVAAAVGGETEAEEPEDLPDVPEGANDATSPDVAEEEDEAPPAPPEPVLDVNGNPVLGENGQVLLAPPGSLVTADGGIITADGAPVLGADGKQLRARQETPPSPPKAPKKPELALHMAKPKPKRPKGPFGPVGWAMEPRGTYSAILQNGLVLMRSNTAQNSANGSGGSMARGLKNALGVEDDDGVVAMTSAPMHRFEQGYYFEVEIESVNNSAVGCLGLGVTFMRPKDIPKMPRRLEKLKQGWYFSGPYNGKTRRLYANGAKSMRFILEGEETRPFRWGIGDKMGVLVRPKDFRAEKWQWTVTLYINRNCVMPVAIDVPPLPNGKIPRELELYAVSEGYGYVTGVRMNRMGTPYGLVMGARKC